jgi:transcriptional regulator with XRE-family HTH domain
MLSLGELILEAIEKSGIAQAVIAQRMGVSRQAINKLATRKTFDLEFLQKLRDASGLDYTNYVFEPKSKKYVDINELTKVNEPVTEYSSKKNLTLNFTISCDRQKVNEFSRFLLEIDQVAEKYGFKII